MVLKRWLYVNIADHMFVITCLLKDNNMKHWFIAMLILYVICDEYDDGYLFKN